MSDKKLPTWNCHLKNPKSSITVGDKVRGSCFSSKPTSLQQDKLKIQVLNKKDMYKVHLLQAHLEGKDSINFELTSYRTGEHKLDFYITDGTSKILVKNTSLQVRSVLEKNQKPHPPFGPWLPPVPELFSFLILLTCLFFLVNTGLFLKRLISRRIFLKKLQDADLDSGVFLRFVKNIRQASGEPKEVLKNIEVAFLQFLEQKFFIPATKLSRHQILPRLQRYQNKVYRQHGKLLQEILKELEYFDKKSLGKSQLFEIKKLIFDLVLSMEHAQYE